MKPAPQQFATASPSPAPHDPWEAAYSRFETPEQEIRKFVARLKEMGAEQWPRESEIAELFCGRGNGLHALEQLGFSRIAGVDLSPRLLAQYTGTAQCTVGDCRKLSFANRSKDIIIAQGGLHHLSSLPADLDQTFAEIRRVLRPTGRAMFIEPWGTPFLRLVHVICENPLARRFSVKFDALATMIEHERGTYEQWLAQPALVVSLAEKHFLPIHQSFAWGKWHFLGTPRP
jgi:SAM-dependent methyltransferase